MKYTIGIDEVGRGPLAGPVCVGLCLFKKQDFKKVKSIFFDANDSKKLSKRKREEIYKKILKNKEFVFCTKTFVSNEYIDEFGISKSIRKALESNLKRILNFSKRLNDFDIKLDGGLKAPVEFKNQETIIKGDQKEIAIMLASIYAKVCRDRYMDKLSKDFPEYFWQDNSGYGTSKHLESIKKYGLSKYHRKYFCKKV